MPTVSDFGSDSSVFNHAHSNSHVNRSRFDLSYNVNFTCDSGMIVPFFVKPTLPHDHWELSNEIALETLPAISNVLTPYKVRTHYYYVRNSDLWEGWNTFITKGRTGNISLRVPQVNPAYTWHSSVSGVDFSFSTPHSLQSFLGVPPFYSVDTDWSFVHDIKGANFLPFISLKNSSTTLIKTGYNLPSSVSALPFMAYQSICKYNYVNQNLLQDNKALFPDGGDNRWMLPYTVDRASSDNFVSFVDGSYSTGSDDIHFSYSGVYSSSENVVGLQCLRYAPFEDDYFTSALPWLQRGDVHTLPFDISLSRIFEGGESGDYSVDVGVSTSNVLVSKTLPASSSSVANALNNMLSDSSIVQSSITANQLRELLAMSVWQERNARVNGSYNSMVWMHYNFDPNVEEHYPRFIGGSSSVVNFSEILSTNSSPSDSSTPPLGTVAGRGSLYDKADISSFDSPDYGYIMGVLIITPVTTYNTAISHDLICENVMEDFYFPEFENLSPQPILNGELFTSSDDTVNKSLFAWQERYSYLKASVNVNRGLFQLPSDVDTFFSSSSQSREFTSIPSLSYQFVTQSPMNTRRDWLAYPSQPMFKVQVANKAFATRPLSYSSVPNTFGF